MAKYQRRFRLPSAPLSPLHSFHRSGLFLYPCMTHTCRSPTSQSSPNTPELIYLPYIWQISEFDVSHLAYIWQTSLRKPHIGCTLSRVTPKHLPYISEMASDEWLNLPYISEIGRKFRLETCADVRMRQARPRRRPHTP